MLTSRHKNLNSILLSKNGVHLTIYLVNRRDLTDLKAQLSFAMEEAQHWLSRAMSIEERRKFLEPLESLLEDASMFKQMKGNVGIFRNESSFRILNIPVNVEESCQVATSFHVKPLIRWLQGDQEFLLLGLTRESAHLYRGSQHTFSLVDSLLLPDFKVDWLVEWLSEVTKMTSRKLFVAGEPELVRTLRLSKLRKFARVPLIDSFGEHNLNEVCQSIRSALRAEASRNLDKALLEFRFAEEGGRASKNLFQIAKAVVKGKVRKLIVTDDLSIFGRVDPKSGGIAIHPRDLDHEDDCILDDLAQMVLSQGGEVIVARRDEIPKGRPILAILEDDHSDERELDLPSESQRENRVS